MNMEIEKPKVLVVDDIPDECAEPDYLRLFVEYARDNEIGYEIRKRETVHFVDIGRSPRCWPTEDLNLGTKAAYEWLVKAHKEAMG